MSIISLSFQQWNKIQDNSNSLILIEFWADWCGPCKEMTTIYQDTQHKNEFYEKNTTVLTNLIKPDHERIKQVVLI